MGTAEPPRVAVPLLERDSMITSEELAAFLGGTITKGTVEQWASRGGGPKFHIIGNHRRYHPADVKAWLGERRYSTAGEAA